MTIQCCEGGILKTGILEEWKVGEINHREPELEYEEAGKVSRREGIDSYDYQIVVQAPDFVINGSLVIKDAL